MFESVEPCVVHPSAAGIPEFHGDCVDAERQAASDFSSATVIHETPLRTTGRQGTVPSRPNQQDERVMPPATKLDGQRSLDRWPEAYPSRTVAGCAEALNEDPVQDRDRNMPVRTPHGREEKGSESELAVEPGPDPASPSSTHEAARTWPKIPCAS